MTNKELSQYIHKEKNGVYKELTTANGIKTEIYMIRPELVYIQPGMKMVSNDSLKYFLISYSKGGREALPQYAGTGSYAALVDNLSFGASKYCRLVLDHKDTIQVNNAQFNNAYGTAPSNTWLLVFKAGLPKDEYELNIDEFGFNTGNTKVVFQKNDIEQLNNIIIKN